MNNIFSMTVLLLLEPHGGFGFYCDITFRQEISDIKFVIQQKNKPKRKSQGQEDPPLDIFDISPGVRRQILGVIPTKRFHEDSKTEIVEVGLPWCKRKY